MNSDIKQLIDGLNMGLPIPDDSFVVSVTSAHTEEELKAGKAKVLHNSLSSSFNSSKLSNASGYEQTISTLEFVKQKVIPQKFFEVNPADYVPLIVGEGAYSNEILHYKSFETGESFEVGDVDEARGSRLSSSEPAFEDVRQKTQAWAKSMDYTLYEVNKAAQNLMPISLIEQKERVRKKNWDLGIQKIAFLGHSTNPDIQGLLNLSGVTNDVATLTKPIKDMTMTEIKTFIRVLISNYHSATNATTFPDTFTIPTTDWLGLGDFVSSTYPTLTKREYLINEFKAATSNPNAQVKALPYCNSTRNNLGVNRYVLYNNDPETLEMNIPIDYTSTSFGTTNGFTFNSVAYGQYTGVIALRPQEIYYMSY